MVKECLANNVGADVFEELSVIGGQWAYAEPDPVTGEVMSSVYHGLIMNTCRDTGGFSDFPADPARYPSYFSHRKYLQFLDEYTEHFDLKRHIKFNTKVISCKQLQDGKWSVVTASKDGLNSEEIYDAVFSCSGHNSIPKIPEFPGMKDFKGEISHSHLYRTPARFQGKRVAIIGLGNSAADIACEIGPQAKAVHVISRKGAWVIPRYILGKPVEAYNSTAPMLFH